MRKLSQGKRMHTCHAIKHGSTALIFSSSEHQKGLLCWRRGEAYLSMSPKAVESVFPYRMCRFTISLSVSCPDSFTAQDRRQIQQRAITKLTLRNEKLT